MSSSWSALYTYIKSRNGHLCFFFFAGWADLLQLWVGHIEVANTPIVVLSPTINHVHHSRCMLLGIPHRHLHSDLRIPDICFHPQLGLLYSFLLPAFLSL